MPQTRNIRRFDLSGGIQNSTSRLLRKSNEVVNAKNAVFGTIIGAAARRNGYTQFGPTIQSGKDGLGAFVHRYSTGTRTYVAVNNSGDTDTSVRYWTGAVWTELFATGVASTRLNSINYLDEAYVVGAGASFMTPRVVDSVPSSSTTRNLTGAPQGAKFIAEFQGALYMMNVRVGGVNYPDRVYKSSVAQGAITFVKKDQSGSLTTVNVDSTQYLKVGMDVTFYTAGTNTSLGNVVITAVDTRAKSITFSSTSLTLQDNDELWLTGRKGKLTVFWNTDDPNPEDADFFRVPASLSEDNTITGYAVTNNRLFIFTKDSTLKWDGQNLITVSTTVGCLQHECARVISSWVVWPHTSGVWAYNDVSGQLKLLSRGIQDIWNAIPLANFAGASSVADNNIYKLAVGAVTSINNVPQVGKLRLVYDFDLNVWSAEWHTRNQRFHVIWTASNVRNTYFLDDTGKFFLDDTGNLDDTATIPFEVEIGPDNFNIDEYKEFTSVYIYSKRPRGTQVFYSIDGNARYEFLGTLQKSTQRLDFKSSVRGYDINYKFAHNDPGEGPIIEGHSTNFSVIENIYAT